MAELVHDVDLILHILLVGPEEKNGFSKKTDQEKAERGRHLGRREKGEGKRCISSLGSSGILD